MIVNGKENGKEKRVLFTHLSGWLSLCACSRRTLASSNKAQAAYRQVLNWTAAAVAARAAAAAVASADAADIGAH